MGQGWIVLGMDLGIAVTPGMDVNSSDNDVGTTCDGFINNDGSGGYLVTSTESNCNPPPSAWSNEFDGGSGFLAGVALGYRLGSFRVEGEYFYRGTTYDGRDVAGGGSVSDDVTQDKVAQELAFIEGGVDDVLSHNFFANLYYDYRSDSKFTPYLGVGIGLARVSVAYRTRWQCSTDLEDIEVFDPGQGEALNQELVGVLTYDRARMSDTLFGYQALAGMDYQVSEPLTIGLKFRYAMFGEFEDQSDYTKLRGHDPLVGNPATQPATYYIRTNDIQFWGVSLNMKYQF